MLRSLKTKLSRNQRNKKIMVREKIGINVPKSTRQGLMMYIINNNNLWGDFITNQKYELQILGVFQYYPPKKEFENNDVWQWATMRMIFDIKQQYFRHK